MTTRTMTIEVDDEQGLVTFTSEFDPESAVNMLLEVTMKLIVENQLAGPMIALSMDEVLNIPDEELSGLLRSLTHPANAEKAEEN